MLFCVSVCMYVCMYVCMLAYEAGICKDYGIVRLVVLFCVCVRACVYVCMFVCMYVSI